MQSGNLSQIVLSNMCFQVLIEDLNSTRIHGNIYCHWRKKKTFGKRRRSPEEPTWPFNFQKCFYKLCSRIWYFRIPTTKFSCKNSEENVLLILMPEIGSLNRDAYYTVKMKWNRIFFSITMYILHPSTFIKYIC